MWIFSIILPVAKSHTLTESPMPPETAKDFPFNSPTATE